MGAELLRALFETTLATSAAVVLVLLLRRPLLARFGASVAYAAWALVPLAGLAMLLPAPEAAPAPMRLVAQIGALSPVSAQAAEAGVLAWTSLLAVLWAMGVIAMAVFFQWQQRRFQRRLANCAVRDDGLHVAAQSEGLPAVVGLLRPRIVLPADFEARYDAAERELILCHERIHLARRDPWANALVAALRAVFWFNPLLHHAARRCRRDQELACDERVVARHPQRRRCYAGAMLKTQRLDLPLPVGCHWQAATPLKERIAMLKEHASTPMRSLLGAALLALLFGAGGYTAWAAQPATATTAQGPLYSVKIRLDIDGEAQDFEVRERAGKPFSFASKSAAGREWRAEFQVQPWPDRAGAMRLAGTVRVDGELRSSPALVVMQGKPVQLSSGDGRSSFKMQAVVAEAGQHATPEPGVGQRQEAGVPVAHERQSVPAYPAEAARQGISGKVLLIVDVAADGSVRDVEIEKAEPAGVFDAAALDAARQWKFQPAIENGKPVAGRVRVPVTFEVEKPAAGDASTPGQGTAG